MLACCRTTAVVCGLIGFLLNVTGCHSWLVIENERAALDAAIETGDEVRLTTESSRVAFEVTEYAYPRITGALRSGEIVSYDLGSVRTVEVYAVSWGDTALVTILGAIGVAVVIVVIFGVMVIIVAASF